MMQKPVRLCANAIKNSIAPYDFYLREQGLLHFGTRSNEWVIAGICPFHEDHSPGSFKISLENGAYICFSCGARGGDIISFTQHKYEMHFRQALEKLVCDWRVLC